MREKCDHYWRYEQVVYEGNTIRRWCSKCGRIEAAKAMRWRQSAVGPRRGEFDDYPDGYPDKFKGVPK